MDARRDEEQFSYALVSAASLQDRNTTGIGIIFKARDRSTIKTICQALENMDEVAAAYEAVGRVLDEALAAGVGRPAIYLDNAEVVAQLSGEVEVPRALLATNLRTRAKMHQVGRPQIIAATTSARFTARRLAQGALSAPHGRLESRPRQLSLLSDAVV
jgi:ribonuclease HI